MFYCGALHSSSLTRRDQLVSHQLSHHFPESSTERSSRRRSALIPRASPEREPAAEQVRVFGAESVRGTVICSGVKIFRYLGIISGKHTMVTTVTPP